jgi:hypothetical protein
MEAKLKHLEMIQSVITRMAGNSFLLKGWTVTLVSALFVLSEVDKNQNFVLLALLPAMAFWGLDSYYLRQERLFRKLYDKVRTLDPVSIDFSMNTTGLQVQSVPRVMFSVSQFWFHGVIVIIILSGFYLIPLLFGN